MVHVDVDYETKKATCMVADSIEGAALVKTLTKGFSGKVLEERALTAEELVAAEKKSEGEGEGE